MRLCRLGKVVLSDDAFQVIMFVSWLVLLCILVVWMGIFGRGGGWAYSFSVSKHLRDSVISLCGKNGNFVWITVGVGGVSWLCIKLYKSLWIEFRGFIMVWWVSISWVYGCGVRICLSGGLGRLANLLINVLVHSMLKWWMLGWANMLLHSVIEGLWL